ncbi:MAG TPA: HEAT repeat domain-containing protein [Planctomycetota bacterium]|nr:HEAT repeat domain-containing protein [Planctomycetota bacterium]
MMCAIDYSRILTRAGRLLTCAALSCAALCADAPKAPASDAALVERALADLGSGDWVLQWEAVHDLAERRAEQAAPKLEELLSDKNEAWLRAEALVALAGIRKEIAIAKAGDFAKDSNAVLRASALKALGLAGGEAALPALNSALKDTDASVRGEALVALAKISGERAWPAVNQALAGDDALVAIRALPYVGLPEAKLKLLALLGGKDRLARMALLSALKEARQPAMVKPLMLELNKGVDRSMQEAIVAALGAVDAQARNPILLEMLEAGETQQVETVLDLVAATRGVEISDRLEKILPRIEKEIPSAAPRLLRFLASRDADRYAAAFTSRLQSATPEVRLAAIEALGRCKKSDRFALLKPMLMDSDARVSEAVFTALRVATRWSPEEGFVGYLDKALRSSDKAIFRNATGLLRDRLSAQEFPKALALLRPSLAGSSDELREIGISALALAADPEGARQVAETQGFVTRWHVVGPFREKDDESAVEELAGTEKEFDSAKKIRAGDESELSWGTYDVDRTDGGIELQTVLSDERLSRGFAIANFKAAAQTARALVSLDGDVTVLLNGKKLADAKEKKLSVDVELNGGANRIFVKVVRIDGARPNCKIRFVDKNGAAVESVQK